MSRAVSPDNLQNYKKPLSFENRGFGNLSMASPLQKGFKLGVSLLTMPYSLFSHLLLTHKKVKGLSLIVIRKMVCLRKLSNALLQEEHHGKRRYGNCFVHAPVIFAPFTYECVYNHVIGNQ
jgi:hypothetical protein